jgi:hypothetical protein
MAARQVALFQKHRGCGREVSTLIVLVTAFSQNPRSQKRAQAFSVLDAIRRKIPLETLGVRDVHICEGHTADEVVTAFQARTRSPSS